MLRRAVSLVLAVFLCVDPASGAVRVLRPVLSPITAPTLRLSHSAAFASPSLQPSLSASSLASPRLKPIASLGSSLRIPRLEIRPASVAVPSPRKSVRAAVRSVAKARSPARAHALYYDGLRVKGGSAPSVVSGRSPKIQNALSHGSEIAVESEASYEVPPKPVERPRKRRFKTGLLLGIAAAAAIPVLYAAVPPLEAANAAAVVLLGLGSAWLGLSVLRGGVRLARRLAGRRAKPRRLRRDLAAGLLIGVILASAPLASPDLFLKAELDGLHHLSRAWADFRGDAEKTRFDKFIGLIGSHKNARPLGSEFGLEAARVMKLNAEGRRMLEARRDRGGRVRLPRFFVAEFSASAAARYVRTFDAVFINATQIRAKGWTVEEFLADPAKQETLIWENRTTIYHELFHSAQFHKIIFVPGQWENFPHQLKTIMALETEYETYIHEQLYVHEELKRNPEVEIRSWDLTQYESYLKDFDGFLGAFGKSSTYKDWHRHIDSKYYNGVLRAERARWPAIGVEGYLLLAQRWEAEGWSWKAKRYRAKARAHALKYGIPMPMEKTS